MHTVRVKFNDPKGRKPERVKVEQRVNGKYRILAEIPVPDSQRIEIKTLDTGAVIDHLRLTVDWSGGLVSVADGLFIGEDRDFEIQPNPDEVLFTEPALTTQHESIEKRIIGPTQNLQGIQKLKIFFTGAITSILILAIAIPVAMLKAKNKGMPDAK